MGPTIIPFGSDGIRALGRAERDVVEEVQTPFWQRLRELLRKVPARRRQCPKRSQSLNSDHTPPTLQAASATA